MIVVDIKSRHVAAYNFWGASRETCKSSRKIGLVIVMAENSEERICTFSC